MFHLRTLASILLMVNGAQNRACVFFSTLPVLPDTALQTVMHLMTIGGRQDAPETLADCLLQVTDLEEQGTGC